MSRPLNTARLQLDPFGPADLGALHRIWTTPEVRRYLFDDETIARDWVAEEIARSCASFETQRYGQWCIRHRNDDEIIGFTGLRTFRGADDPQLLYGLESPHWGKGLATEAAEAVVDYAFAELDFARILASIDEPNVASVGVMRHLGMTALRERRVDGRATLFYEIARSARVEIRTYRSSDFDEIEALWTRVFPSTAPYHAAREVVRRMVDEAPDLFFVAALDGRLVGSVLAGWDGHRGWIYSMAVDPQRQRRGFGSKLLRHAVLALEQRGCPNVSLQIRADNDSVVQFYRRHGFDIEERISMGRTLHPDSHTG
ncbi:MAG: GNAT family acetyltransferase [Acidobacteriota bacterium]|nr:GNAT family acetyltransferase [Acidobacteriota bacterium]